ncbi:MAG: DUF3450 domain-containing protein [Lachnospiraceae bacterium]|nr:DUF3450 domain-containing protein [Lachnospiraceae bacterium]
MPVNITEEFVRQLMAQVDFLTKQNSSLTATVDSMNQTIAELNQTIRELKEQLNKNSKNSLILSILVDTFISKISLTMQPGPKIDSISGA